MLTMVQSQNIIILITYIVNIIVIILTHHVDNGAALLSRVLHHHLAELAVAHLHICNMHQNVKYLKLKHKHKIELDCFIISSGRAGCYPPVYI